MNEDYKGIILAGGQGTRLLPITKVVSKQLLPVYDKPMIFYPLLTLVKSGIKEILIITNPSDEHIFSELLGNGSDFDCSITYKTQKKPEGIAQAFLIAEEWLGDSNSILILGDNIFANGNISKNLKHAMSNNQGSTIFAYKVQNPNRYGVLNITSDNKLISVVEKPKNPPSNWAVTGLYVYDKTVVEKTKKLKPSERNELEITDLNNIYINDDKMNIFYLPEDSFWMDAGTKDSLLEASILIKTLSDKGLDIF